MCEGIHNIIAEGNLFLTVFNFFEPLPSIAFSMKQWPALAFFAVIWTFGLKGMYLILTGDAGAFNAGTCITVWVLSGIGITVGYHRLFSHNSYEAGTAWRVIMIVLGTWAVQGTAYGWAKKHRVHHKYSDTDADPYNIRRGFFFSHVGWIFAPATPEHGRAMRAVYCADLKSDGIVMWQKKNYAWLAPLVSMCTVPFIYTLLGLNPVDGFMYNCAGLLLNNQATFAINSVNHRFGLKSGHDIDIDPRQNVPLMILAHGEGWHMTHHIFPYDYSGSEFGSFMNLSTFIIDAAAAIGLVGKRYRANMRKVDVHALPTLKVHEVSAFMQMHNRGGKSTVVACKGMVLDLTEFAHVHPGGKMRILAGAGNDVTKDFERVSHSKEAVYTLSQFAIARIE